MSIVKRSDQYAATWRQCLISSQLGPRTREITCSSSNSVVGCSPPTQLPIHPAIVQCLCFLGCLFECFPMRTFLLFQNFPYRTATYSIILSHNHIFIILTSLRKTPVPNSTQFFVALRCYCTTKTSLLNWVPTTAYPHIAETPAATSCSLN